MWVLSMDRHCCSTTFGEGGEGTYPGYVTS
uniref:Uncharacterized protein n=1 Tax=Anguilla anguilla TaxID=7936 RepID=A0A0E9TM02_ANGAN